MKRFPPEIPTWSPALDAERLHDLSPERRARIYRARRIRVLFGAIATGTLLAGTAVAAASTFSGSDTAAESTVTRRSDDGTRRRMADTAGRKSSANRVEQENWEFARVVAESRRETDRRTAEAEAAVAAAKQRRVDQAAAQAKAAEKKKAAAAAETEQAATSAERIAKAKQTAKAEKAAELAEQSGRDSTAPSAAAAATTAAPQQPSAAERAAAKQAADGTAWMEAAARTEQQRAAAPAPAPAPAAEAPIGAPWVALAECEASGNWAMNSGNGYYGGLQFNLGTWKSHGGNGMPHENSPAQQIEIAKRVQASQGWGAWPACSRKIGLR